MNKFSIWLNSFMINSIKFLLPLVIIGSIFRVVADNLIPGIGFFIILGIYSISILVLFRFYKTDSIDYKRQLFIILSIALVVRALWLLNTDTVLFSDFATMYEGAKGVLNGDYSAFSGNAYIARFPHLTFMTLYFAFMIKIFGESLITLKVVNLILGVVSVYLIYKICNEVFKSFKLGIIGAGIAAIFPPMVTYTGVMCTENIAIPLYLLSIYIFILATKKNKPMILYILSGILLSLGNLFRMVAIITLIAMSIYIVLYVNKSVIYKVKSVLCIVISFMFLLIGTSYTFQVLGITEYQLWSGAEPASTNILKGTNIKSIGMWNEEDAKVPDICGYDYEKMDKMSKEIIKERLTETPIYIIVPFYIVKFATQWYDGDCEGTFWTEQGVTENDMFIKISEDGRVLFQLFYISLLLLSWKGLRNKKVVTNEYININLFYLMICGYGVSYLITENQSRYSYIVSWLFVIFAVAGLEELKNE